MNAIWVTTHGGPEVLTLQEKPIPEPGPNQLVIRVAAAGVNPVDTYLRTGTYTNAKVPYTPGFDCGGVVESLGPNVSRFRKGDRVYTGSSVSGTYAQFALCDETDVYPLPSNLTFAQGAALGVPYATAYRALVHRGAAISGEKVLIHGASGGVGIAAVQLAHAAGLTVIGSSGTERGRALILENGGQYALDHKDANLAAEIMRLTEGQGVNLILEMLANVNLGKDLTLLAKFGRVVVIGSRGPVEINPRDAMSRDASIHGMTLFNVSREELKAIHAALFEGLASGSLRPIIGQEFPLSQAPQAHAAVLAPGAYGKIVLIP